MGFYLHSRRMTYDIHFKQHGNHCCPLLFPVQPSLHRCACVLLLVSLASQTQWSDEQLIILSWTSWFVLLVAALHAEQWFATLRYNHMKKVAVINENRASIVLAAQFDNVILSCAVQLMVFKHYLFVQGVASTLKGNSYAKGKPTRSSGSSKRPDRPSCFLATICHIGL